MGDEAPEAGVGESAAAREARRGLVVALAALLLLVAFRLVRAAWGGA